MSTGATLYLRGTSYGRVSVCVSVCLCLSQVGVLSKGLDELTWFLTGRLLSNSFTLRYKEMLLSHARTVVRECCKGDDESQWERVKFDPPPPKHPLTDGHQNLHT